MAGSIISQYFESKKINIAKYNETVKSVYTMSNMKVLSGALTTLALWDMFMMVNHLAGNKDTGCVTQEYLVSFKSSDMVYEEFIKIVHTSRNEIAHMADDIEILVGNIADILRSYKYYDVLQKDLDMIFKGTNLTVSANRLFEIYDVKLQRKYKDTEAGAQKSSITDKLQDELPDIIDEFKG